MDLELVQGLEVTVSASREFGDLPAGHTLFVMEKEDWDSARQVQEAVALGIHSRRVFFDEQRRRVGKGFAAGRELAFLVEPDDLVIEPATILVGEHGPRSVEIRWHPRR